MSKTRKTFLLVFILLVISGVVFFVVRSNAEYTVLKIEDGDSVYIDFNDNGIAEYEEKKGLSDIDAFETKANRRLSRQARDYGLSEQEALELGYLAKELLKEKVLNKKVKVKFTDKKKRYALIYLNGELVQDELIESGLAVPYRRSGRYKDNSQQLEDARKRLKNRELVILNLKNNKYHKPDCKYGVETRDYELVERKNLPEDAKACGFCKSNIREYKVNHNEQRTYTPVKRPQPQNVIPEKPIPDVKTQNIELYFIDPMDYKMPADFCRTSAVQALIREINRAKKSIDFSVFGFSNQQELVEAIKRAFARGVKVRWVTDATPWGFNFYKGTKDTMSQIPNYKTDYLTDKRLLREHRAEGKNYYNGTLIHNKFFIIDKKLIWTGSTNISSSGTGGYNANISAVIRSDEIAKLYTQEFEQMYVQERFHKDKKIILKKDIKLADGSEVDIYFSPNPNIVKTGIKPVIESAKKSIYIPMFYLTSREIFASLINAQKRDIDIKVIVDAHYAKGQHSNVQRLRKEGIPVKVENWGGKMHMKSLIVDDLYFIIGSTNFTKTGFTKNDENLLIIKNSLLAKTFSEKFMMYWKNIPDKWLHSVPLPESKDSTYSCNDGIDNDHDELLDINDPDCT